MIKKNCFLSGITLCLLFIILSLFIEENFYLFLYKKGVEFRSIYNEYAHIIISIIVIISIIAFILCIALIIIYITKLLKYQKVDIVFTILLCVTVMLTLNIFILSSKRLQKITIETINSVYRKGVLNRDMLKFQLSYYFYDSAINYYYMFLYIMLFISCVFSTIFNVKELKNKKVLNENCNL